VARAQVNGTDLFYASTGEGAPVVLVHGSWSDGYGWARMVPLLARRHRVITYDRRGHSQSARPSPRGGIRADEEDLAALVDHLGLGPAHMVGSSLGGTVTLRLASRRPELFRTLSVHEPPAAAVLDEIPEAQAVRAAARGRLQAVEERLRTGDWEGGARLFIDTIAFEEGAWDRLHRLLQRTFLRNASTYLEETGDPESFRLDLLALARCKVPVLLTRGARSDPFFGPIVARLAQTLPRAQVKVFPEAGHVPHATHPRELAAALLDLFERHPNPER
jgi:pimeloyl-ACP methyl ester carboxylesterase